MSTQALTRALNAAGYPCEKRTVERDLAVLNSAPEWKEIGVLLVSSSDPVGRSRLWAHDPTSKMLLFSVLPPQEAMLMSILEQELKVLLPATVSPVLSRLGHLADDVLSQPHNRSLAEFRERIRVLPEGPLEIAPTVDVAHLATIAECLLQGVQLDLEYWSSALKEVKRYRLHPVGLIRQGLFFWLLALKEEHAYDAGLADPVQTFRVDRIRAAYMRSYDLVTRGLPSLEQALARKGTKFFPTEHVQLRLRFAQTRSASELCNNYRDTPLSHDQRIVESANGVLELTATVRLSLQLKWMLQGQASHVRVIAPQSLHDQIAEAVQAAAVMYG